MSDFGGVSISRRLVAVLAALGLLAGCGSGEPITPPATTGTIDLSVTGLPAGAIGAVAVDGPNGFHRIATASQTIPSLAPGTYVVTASTVTASGTDYLPNPTSQNIPIIASNSATTVTVAYTVAPPPGALNLTVDKVYLTQSVQTLNNGVRLVANRDGYLRVFVKANQFNTATPKVKVDVYAGAALAQSFTINAPDVTTPTTVDESSLTKSWNAAIPRALIAPGMKLLVTVDPDAAVTEATETDNTWPLSGTPAAQTVDVVAPFRVMFVPVVQGGLTGDVTLANADPYLAIARKMHPISTDSVFVHAPYTATHGPLQASDGNHAWLDILAEMDVLRQVEGSTRHYYGVVKTGYQSGIAGLAYVGGFNSVDSTNDTLAFAGMGWDFASNRANVFAHEIGHNWSRLHSPCNVTTLVDPNYPQSDGTIGSYGLDVATTTLYAPSATDVMGYCTGNVWISDYTYAGILRWRARNISSAAIVASAAPQRSLIVWGRAGSDGLTLAPAFEVTTRPSLPSGGPYSIEGYDAAGTRLFSLPFTPREVADVAPGTGSFAFAIPATVAKLDRLASLGVRGPGGAASLSSARMVNLSAAQSVIAAPAVAAAGNQTTITWDATASPLAVVRDAATGQVLSIARGGQATISSAARAVDVILSDGVQSRTSRVAVAGR